MMMKVACCGWCIQGFIPGESWVNWSVVAGDPRHLARAAGDHSRVSWPADHCCNCQPQRTQTQGQSASTWRQSNSRKTDSGFVIGELTTSPPPVTCSRQPGRTAMDEFFLVGRSDPIWPFFFADRSWKDRPDRVRPGSTQWKRTLYMSKMAYNTYNAQ